jgi:hypothetical protein
MSVTTCPGTIAELDEAARMIATTWATSELRPRVAPAMQDAWEVLIKQWVESCEVPLFVRKHQNNRGARIKHQSGRVVVPADNGPAHWAISLALEGICPTLDEIRRLISEGRIPVAMIVKKVEVATFSFQQGLPPLGVNKAGWKVCHIERVALGSRTPLEDVPITALEKHFVRFLSPMNMFLVPLAYSCIGELPQMTQAIQRIDGLVRVQAAAEAVNLLLPPPP